MRKSGSTSPKNLSIYQYSSNPHGNTNDSGILEATMGEVVLTEVLGTTTTAASLTGAGDMQSPQPQIQNISSERVNLNSNEGNSEGDSGDRRGRLRSIEDRRRRDFSYETSSRCGVPTMMGGSTGSSNGVDDKRRNESTRRHPSSRSRSDENNHNDDYNDRSSYSCSGGARKNSYNSHSKRRTSRPGLGAPSWSLIVKNLPRNINRNTLQDAIERFGVNVKDIYIPINYYTRESRDFAFVEYFDEESMLQALRDTMDMELEGTRLIIEEARSSRKTSEFFTSSYRSERRYNGGGGGGRDYNHRDNGPNNYSSRRERSGGRNSNYNITTARISSSSRTSRSRHNSGRERWRSSSRER